MALDGGAIDGNGARQVGLGASALRLACVAYLPVVSDAILEVCSGFRECRAGVEDDQSKQHYALPPCFVSNLAGRPNNSAKCSRKAQTSKLHSP